MPSPTIRAAAEHAPTHPALRWTPQWRPDTRGQHRRIDASTTSCGLTGAPLVPAETADPFCGACYPRT